VVTVPVLSISTLLVLEPTMLPRASVPVLVTTKSPVLEAVPERLATCVLMG